MENYIRFGTRNVRCLYRPDSLTAAKDGSSGSGMEAWTGSIWLRIETGGGHL